MDSAKWTLGTVSTWPMFFADDVIRILYERSRSPNARWKIGRRKWITIQQMKDGHGTYIFHSLTSYGHEDEITLMGYPVDIIEGDEVWMDDALATGPTERLPKVCRECGDRMLERAMFCISCGTPVETE